MPKYIFDQFTNKYSLSKTLRFELRPVGNTQQMLDANGIVAIDKTRKERYEATKPWINKLHQEFINDSLVNVTLRSLDGYIDLYQEWQVNRKLKGSERNIEIDKRFEIKEKEIRNEIVELFEAKAAEWIATLPEGIEVKKENHEFLFEPTVFSILKQKYGSDSGTVIDGQSIFDSWHKWTAYFGKFFETRKNFYKNDGTATAVATRIVNENLRRFVDNIALFERIKSKIKTDNFEQIFGLKPEDAFAIDYYNKALGQSGIDAYNQLIGGDREKKYKGINQLVNECRQKTGEKLPRLKQLDKQIGSDKEAFLGLIETDVELHEQLVMFVKNAKHKLQVLDEAFAEVISDQSNLAGIFFRKEAVNTIGRRWFASYELFADALTQSLKQSGEKKAGFDKNSEEYKFPDFVSWQILKVALESLVGSNKSVWKEHYFKDISDLSSKDIWCQFLMLFQHEYARLRQNGHEKTGKDFFELAIAIEEKLSQVNFNVDDPTKEAIKLFADRVLRIYQFAKYFSIEKSRQWNPDGLETDDFYVMYQQYYDESYEVIVKTYDKIRNYLTRKPFNQNKWKLNFENPTLAAGWDQNKETDNTAIILRRNGRYLLAIMDRRNNTIFKNVSSKHGGYEKVVYKLFPDPSKMMPKVCFSAKGRDFFKPSEEILRIYNNAEFKKGDTFSVTSMQKLIAFYKQALNLYPGWSMYRFGHVKDSDKYRENIGEFYRDVAVDGYQLSFENVDEHYIQDANANGKLYLFEIHNKDWNLASRDGVEKISTKNVHTLYFEQAFSSKNVAENFVVKLNGEAELFFRPATSAERLGHRQDKNGKIITNKNGDPVVRNKRYAQDKIFFHVPLTFNRTALPVTSNQFNRSINQILADNPEINIIGIDRGEKHLAYLSVINQKSEILEIKSLNTVNGVAYAELLDERMKSREAARRDWKNVEQIKDLKKGYISSVVRVIADLIIKHNAIVVFEDLNMRFKQVRGGIEKSVYQQLEKALIDKLNFLVDKHEIDPRKAGHILHAYQLTAPFSTFKEMGKQAGLLFYTQAEYTSQTDPITGFRKNIYISNSETVSKIREFIQNFDNIGWDEERQSYYFVYNPINFVAKEYKDSTLSRIWKIYADVPRVRRENKNGYWTATALNPNEKFEELFKLWGFDNAHGSGIKEQIKSKDLNGTKEFDGKPRNFWHSFVYLFNLMMQVRNSTATEYKRDSQGDVVDIIEGVDFIASPVEPFFTTDGGRYTQGRVNLAFLEKKFIGGTENKEQFKKEFNGDANGAYNIARKGVIILNKITSNREKPDLFISKNEWDEFVTSGQGGEKANE